MEHTLQVLLVLIFAWQAAERLAGERSDWLRPSVVAALMVATRYESLFLVAVAGAILLWQGRIRPVVCLGVAAAVPVAAFALYSVAHGGLVLPNSVLMKSGPGRFSTVGAGVSAVATDWLAIGNLFLRPSLLVLTLGVLIGLLLTPSARLTSASRSAWLAVLFLGTSLLHACLVKVEWFFRYEAYLMALGLLAIAGLAGQVEWPAGVPAQAHRAAAPRNGAAARAAGAAIGDPRADGALDDRARDGKHSRPASADGAVLPALLRRPVRGGQRHRRRGLVFDQSPPRYRGPGLTACGGPQAARRA